MELTSRDTTVKKYHYELKESPRIDFFVESDATLQRYSGTSIGTHKKCQHIITMASNHYCDEKFNSCVLTCNALNMLRAIVLCSDCAGVVITEL